MEFTKEEKKIFQLYNKKALQKIKEQRRYKTKEYIEWKEKLNQLYSEWQEIADFYCSTKSKTLQVESKDSLGKKIKEIEQHVALEYK